MEYREIIPVNAPISGFATVPGSKSITNRALVLAAMARGESTLTNCLFSGDSRAMTDCLKTLGFEICVNEREKTVKLCGGKPKNASVNVKSAGTAARFLTAYLAASGGEYIIDASEQMRKRPMKPLFDALKELGAGITYLNETDYLPVCITGGCLTGGSIKIPSQQSSQFISALLMTAPLYENGLKIIPCGHFTSKSYVDITVKMMKSFGVSVIQKDGGYTVSPAQKYTALNYAVEPDVSAACYFYAAAVLTGGELIVRGVRSSSMQGDLKFLYALRDMGCSLTEEQEGFKLAAPSNGEFSGIDIDMNGFSDQALTLSAIAPFAKTPTRIRGAAHIRAQECNRIAAIVAELTKMGINCTETSDGVIINPGLPRASYVETYNDHRVAMSFALVGLRVAGIKILNPECTQKTFEGYFDTLERVIRNK